MSNGTWTAAENDLIVADYFAMLADDIAVAADGLSVQFHLNPLARFSNGDTVTAHDVAYSYNTLVTNPTTAKQGVEWLVAKYKAAHPSEGSFVESMPGAAVGDAFDAT